MVERDLAKVDTRVRFPSSAPLWCIGVAVNMPPCHGGDHGFDSRTHRHDSYSRLRDGFFVVLLAEDTFDEKPLFIDIFDQ